MMRSGGFGSSLRVSRLGAGWMSVIGCLAVLAFAVGPASAGDTGAAVPPALQGFASTPSAGLLNSGLIDLSRFDVRHSLSYSMSSGSGYRSQSAGLWQSELGYRISDPLRVSLSVGATITPGGESLFNERSVFLQGFNLDYRPSKNFMLNISYINMPPEAAQALGYGAAPYRYSRRPWDSPLDPDR